jgi:ribonuclease HII
VRTAGRVLKVAVPSPAGHRPHLRVEKELLRTGTGRLAAMDEVGRGALAGPVTVGVVVVTAIIGRVPPGLRDSKLLTPAARDALVTPVRRWVAEWAVGHASPTEIDTVGIIAALRSAGRRALAALSSPVDAVLLDGNHDYLSMPTVAAASAADPGLFDVVVLPEPAPDEPPVHVRVKADLTCAAVAGASVLAKTERDRLLVELSPAHPEYGFAVNKGYGTPEHLAALRRYGPSVAHRRSWRLPCEDPDLFGVPQDALM